MWFRIAEKKEKPSLTPLTDVECADKDDISFETTVAGKPEPAVEWLKGDSKLTPSDRILVEKDGAKHRLTVKQVVANDAASYSCKATNPVGSVTVAAKLKVKAAEVERKPEEKKKSPSPQKGGAPEFVEEFSDATVTEKQTLELKAKVKGDPEPAVTWYRDGKQLAATLKVSISKTKDEHTVKIQQVTSAAAGTYKCVATNKLGSAEHSAVVTVTGMEFYILKYISFICEELLYALPLSCT